MSAGAASLENNIEITKNKTKKVKVELIWYSKSTSEYLSKANKHQLKGIYMSMAVLAFKLQSKPNATKGWMDTADAAYVHACVRAHTHTHACAHRVRYSAVVNKRGETSRLQQHDWTLKTLCWDIGHWTVDMGRWTLCWVRKELLWSNLCLESKETTLSSGETGGWQERESLVKAVQKRTNSHL